METVKWIVLQVSGLTVNVKIYQQLILQNYVFVDMNYVVFLYKASEYAAIIRYTNNKVKIKYGIAKCTACCSCEWASH